LALEWTNILSLAHADMYFTFLHAGRHFQNFLEIYPVKKRKSLSRKDRIQVPRRALILDLDHAYLASESTKYDILSPPLTYSACRKVKYKHG
jgi:hypothetical protein